MSDRANIRAIIARVRNLELTTIAGINEIEDYLDTTEEEAAA